MAVSKSRRISGWILIALLVLSAIVCGIFFFGGINYEEVEGIKAYNQTSILLWWMYILLGLTLVITLVFAIVGFSNLFKKSPKRAMRGLLGFVGLIVLLVVTYFLGNGDPSSLQMLSEDSNQYMTPFWLKTSDMVIYSCEVLLVLCVVALVWGAVRAGAIVKPRGSK